MELLANYFRNPVFSHNAEGLVAVALVLIRVLAFLHMAPIFGHKSLSSMTRTGLAIFLTMIMINTIPLGPPPEIGYYLPWSVMLNVALGLLLGFASKMMFETAVAAGEMMDSSMGFSSAQTFDPQSGSQTTIMGKFMSMLSVVVFFVIGGPEKLIIGLHKSFTSFALYDPIFKIDVMRLVHLAGDIIAMGFIIVSPVVLTILVTDVILGIISRASPQINAFQISFTVKPIIGIVIFLMILPLFFIGLSNFFGNSSRLFGFN